MQAANFQPVLSRTILGGVTVEAQVSPNESEVLYRMNGGPLIPTWICEDQEGDHYIMILDNAYYLHEFNALTDEA